jgi:hypothetical protein
MPLAKFHGKKDITWIFDEHVDSSIVNSAYDLMATIVREHPEGIDINRLVYAFSEIDVLGTRPLKAKQSSYILDQIYEKNLIEKKLEFCALEKDIRETYNGLVFVSPGKRRAFYNRLVNPEALKG